MLLGTPKATFCCDYKNVNLENIKNYLANFNWNNLYLEVDVDKRVKIFSTLVNELLELHVPLKERICIADNIPWFNRDVKIIIKSRNAAYVSWRSNKTDANWKIYTNL